jgi:hypothetical protein
METFPPFQRINLKELSQRVTEDYQNVIVNEVNEIHRTRALQRTVNLCFEHTEAATEFINEL